MVAYKPKEIHVEYYTINFPLLRDNKNKYMRLDNNCSNDFDNVLPDSGCWCVTGITKKLFVLSNSIP